jgi:putative ABC transport system permease protein
MIPFRYNLRSLTVRKATTLATALGIALVVFVLASALMLSNGIRETLGRSGRADNAIVLKRGSDSELGSSLEQAQVGLIAAQPGVKKDASGQPLGVGELVVNIALPRPNSDAIGNVQIRGVPGSALAFRPEVKLIDGRAAKAGTDEAIIGKQVRGRFEGLELGQTFEMRKHRPVTIVGVFEDGGSSFESEVWADLDTVRSSFGRDGLVSSVRVRLESPDRFDALAAAIAAQPQLGLEAKREPAFYEEQSADLSAFIRVMGVLITVFFSLGAMIGAMITMYASVANRQKEIGTLRALGFLQRNILTSFLLESMVLALVGGLVGIGGAVAMKFVKFSMLNPASFSEMVFSFTPTPGILLFSVLFAGITGLVGGFFPAFRAARVSVLEALKG